MADVVIDDAILSTIAEVLRDGTESEDTYLPTEMPGAIDYMYGKAYEDGHNDGHTAGEKAQYDYFWDNFQQNGNRTDYSYAFCNWDNFKQCFKPKYDIKPTGSIASMFRSSTQYVSIPTLCENAGITLDFSSVTLFTNFLYDTAFYRVGIIDCSSATTLSSAFNNATSLKTIDKLIVHEGITSYTDCFANMSQLQNITIEGVIAASFNVSAHSKLTLDSLKSIITHLKDFSGTSNTYTRTLTLNAKCWETLDADGENSPNGTTWATYVDSLGWNI